MFSKKLLVLSFSALILSSVPVFAKMGTESGGGRPPYIATPNEQFLYSCSINLSEQSTDSQTQKTCYSSAKQEIKFQNSDLDTTHLAPFLLVETNESGWQKDYSWNDCPELPSHLSGHMLQITLAPDFKTKEPMAELYVRVQKKEENDLLYADSSFRDLFSATEIKASASFAHSGRATDGVSHETLILTLKADCKRIK